MKKLLIITVSVVSAFGLVSCGGAHGEDPGHAYMPDMYYSRAYETYGYNDVGGEYDSLKRRGIFYNGMPVQNTIARGENYVYHLTADSAGMAAAESIKNPLDSANAQAFGGPTTGGGVTTGGNGTSRVDIKEAERLYLVNCGICHGVKLDGNGPLWNGGNGPYPAKPQDLIGYGSKLSDGHFFHVITFGIRSMGSYASQLSPQQRWMVIKYIRSKQAGTAPKPVADSVGKSAPPNNLVVDTSKTRKNLAQ